MAIAGDFPINNKSSTSVPFDMRRVVLDRDPFGRVGEVGKLEPSLAAHKSEGKPLVNDLDPRFILEMGEVMRQGLTKYPNEADGTPNWWKGGDYRSFCASILRHALKVMAGEDIDEESGLPHTAHIAVDSMFLYSWQRRKVGADTRLGDTHG